MAYLTFMLKFVCVVLNSLASKLNLLFIDVDEYMKGKSCGDSKCIHSKNHSNIKHITYQGALY